MAKPLKTEIPFIGGPLDGQSIPTEQVRGLPAGSILGVDKRFEDGRLVALKRIHYYRFDIDRLSYIKKFYIAKMG